MTKYPQLRAFMASRGIDDTDEGGLAEIVDVVQRDLAAASGDVPGLPVAGYKRAQPPEAIAAVNRNKHIEELILRDMDELAKQAKGGSPIADPRWLATARTQIEKGFMSYNRAIFQPTRVAGDLMIVGNATLGDAEAPDAPHARTLGA